MKLLTGNAHPELAKKVADCLEVDLVDATVNSFPDGETFVQIHENIRDTDLYIIQPTCTPANQNLMELLIMVDAARRASAGSITAVIPFFGYARQDRKDKSRVPITAKLVANLLSSSGVDRVITIDLHAPQIQGFFDIPVDHLYAKPVFTEVIRKKGWKDLVVLSPDVGGVKIARSYAEAFEAQLAIVAKNRLSATEVETMDVIGDVKGKNVIIVDDMTETAGTLCAAAREAKKAGAKRIFAVVSHTLLVGPGVKRLEDSDIEILLTTNTTTIEAAECSKIEIVGIEKTLAEAIRRCHNGESVSSLFDL